MGAPAGLVFGPVPSRRFGRSLGVNHVPAKTCSYACVYCQAGPTTASLTEPHPFLEPPRVVEAVAERLRQLGRAGEAVDVVTFVPDGEPTLDLGLAAMVRGVRGLGVPVAVLTNGSLLHRKDVVSGLREADMVSVKVDSVDEGPWRRVNRPHPGVRLAAVLEGVRAFAASYAGRLLTETMLVRGVNDAEAAIRATARFVAALSPTAAYVSVPSRPPAVPGTARPSAGTLVRALAAFRSAGANAVPLVDYEGDAFASGGDARDDLLAIAAVHPLREDAALAILRRAGAPAEDLARLVADGRLVVLEHEGHRFYAHRPAAAGPGEARL